MACAICEVRKPRRFCPGVRGDICTICCGTEREVTVECPLDCVYLQDAHRHERTPEIKPEDIPNTDIRVSDSFLEENSPLLMFLSRAILDASANAPGIIDNDVREALDALIRTYRTLESGVVYETRPANPLADHIRGAVQNAAEELRRLERERVGMTRTRDADILGILAFLQRMELAHNNGRRRGRAFLDFLRHAFGPAPAETQQPPSILTP